MPSVPAGGVIVVTGVNGYLGSVASQVFIKHGYRVRGTVRSVASYGWMKSFFGPKFELVEVPDLESPGALDAAIRGVDGIAHIAMNLNFDMNDAALADKTVKSHLQLLESAAKEPSVKSVVVTSSQAACILPTTGTPYEINSDTYNTTSIDLAAKPWNGEGDPFARRLHVYGAAKARGEQACFEWVREHKPAFDFNTVLPDVIFGAPVSPEKLGFRSSAAIFQSFVKGQPHALFIFPSQWYVDVEDAALLHLAALTLDDVRNERLLGFAGQYSWTQIVEILHRRFPQLSTVPASVDEPAVDCGRVDNSRSLEVLTRLKGDGFTSLEETIVKAVNAIIENDA
ncbi:hypothetical protein NQ176_g930 [Zarea fungicola]|uniref:Uncharacterized protein n=1 Tax=Zarea fungicola TaxID=93591 RepID=A0ACC1NUW5_9HYPO|nr:hypothetical protein NQ176_g930 [Lecanicillium fungicola]